MCVKQGVKKGENTSPEFVYHEWHSAEYIQYLYVKNTGNQLYCHTTSIHLLSVQAITQTSFNHCLIHNSMNNSKLHRTLSAMQAWELLVYTPWHQVHPNADRGLANAGKHENALQSLKVAQIFSTQSTIQNLHLGCLCMYVIALSCFHLSEGSHMHM